VRQSRAGDVDRTDRAAWLIPDRDQVRAVLDIFDVSFVVDVEREVLVRPFVVRRAKWIGPGNSHPIQHGTLLIESGVDLPWDTADLEIVRLAELRDEPVGCPLFLGPA